MPDCTALQAVETQHAEPGNGFFQYHARSAIRFVNDNLPPKSNLVRFHLRQSLLTLLILFCLALFFTLFLASIGQASGKTVFVLGIMLAAVGLVMFLDYRNFVWPSEQFLSFIIALSRQNTPSVNRRIPKLWRPWFAAMEKIFHDKERMARQIRTQNEILEKRFRERTAELDTINAALREEIEERGKAEKALQVANQKLQELSLTDGLTGIANYRKFDEYLQQIWKRMIRERSPVSIIICDVDYFKQFNDTYGHQAGDFCLQEIAHAIESTLQRPDDLAARYGGEEFIVLLPGTDDAGAVQVAEKIQNAISELDIPHAESPAAPCVTFSVGLATAVPELGSVPKTLLKAAERALYRAKNGGRNRIVT
jgi:diguanylate cyclase (GGDEF)-like protein